MNYTTEFATTSGADVKPSHGTDWNYAGSFSTGHVWKRIIFVGKDCLYPSRTYVKTVKCSIRYHVSADMTMPSRKTVASDSKGTGYTENSKNYKTCVNSAGAASVQAPVTEYGYYSVNTWQRAQNAQVEVAYTKDGLTGEIAAPKIISLSPAYNTVPKQGMTGSLDCRHGWRSPGVVAKDFWTDKGCEGDVSTSYTCQKPNVQVDLGEGSTTSMRPVGSAIQMMRDGKARKMVWGQSIKGNNVTVKAINTRFTRSGTPWDSKLPVNTNLFDLSTSKTGKSIWKNSSETSWMSGNHKTVYVAGYAASNPGSRTVLKQELGWKGTKKQRSAEIVSINPNTGDFVTRPIVVTVPTSGSCEQTVSLEYQRAIGGA